MPPADKQARNLERLSDLISPRTGIIRSVSRISRGTEEPNPPVICQGTVSHFDFRNAKPVERTVSGKGETERDAKLGAIGEALERYCSSQFAANSFVRAAAAELSGAALLPAEFVLYSQQQYRDRAGRYEIPDNAKPIAWARGYELPGLEPILAPASLVYLSYTGDQGSELFTPPTSNGLAAGPDLSSAILGSLLELIERDAFLIMWMNRLPVARVDYSALTGVARRIRMHYQRFGIDAMVFDMTTDIQVPAMMAVAVDSSGKGPAAVVGLGCHLDPAVAVEKALMEVCQVRPSESLKFVNEPPQERLQGYADIRSLEDHAGFVAIRDNLREFGFLFDSGKRARVEDLSNAASGDPQEDLRRCVAALRKAGSRVAYAELTTPDIQPFGVHVVRGIATGLQPMHFGYGEERLGGRRLFEVPARLGYGAKVRTAADLNPCPHPLA
jgi:ribosomal protein S12 methylthiotransferase accessory factor